MSMAAVQFPNVDVEQGRKEFDKAINSLQQLPQEISYNVGTHLLYDAQVRSIYSRRILEAADEIYNRAKQCKVTWKQAATEANQLRNVHMKFLRSRSTPVGRAYAEMRKRDGRTLNEMIAKKTLELHDESTNFRNLSNTQKNKVYLKIVVSAGKSNEKLNKQILRLSRAGKMMMMTSLAISTYQVMTSQEWLFTAAKEFGVAVSSVTGGIVGGAIAGVACGPGAPVCVTAGAFVGGVTTAFAMDMALQ